MDHDRLPIMLLTVAALVLLYGCLRPRCGHAQGKVASRSAGDAEFVMFHSPSCGHCVRAMPAFDRLKPPSHVRKTKVDCKARADVAAAHGINAYPTYRLYPNGMQHTTDFVAYHGPRDEAALGAFLNQNTRHVRFAE